jgi:hypothetical protein
LLKNKKEDSALTSEEIWDEKEQRLISKNQNGKNT